ncbi:hypothetical protein B296_00006863 [Ensete ventricosum]|uniref:Uncharacterized protein n=1 Tax=Ensete ventricosum TaxID=4639 RepID=A0A426ZU12_ENSVE|nr:hypothetical protein B296_00006863 [Ensete ventricosum]
MAGEDAGKDKVGGVDDKDAQEEEEGPGDHYMPSVRLVDTHPPKVGSEAPELIVSTGEAACVRRSARQ